MNIAERRLPQDGRFRIKASGREIDVRVSALPTIYGEKIVMRILDLQPCQQTDDRDDDHITDQDEPVDQRNLHST